MQLRLNYMIIVDSADGEHSIRHVHQFSRQHAMVFCSDENGAVNVHVTSSKLHSDEKEKAARSA
jgi:hypothetical protein